MRISAISKKPPAKLLEKQVTEQVRDYLEYRGWRAIRMQRTVVPGAFQSGEPGMPDYLFLMYLPDRKSSLTALALALWIEFKSPTDKRNCRCRNDQMRSCGFCTQASWRDRERRRGGTVWVINDFDWFTEVYEKHFAWVDSGDSAIGQMDLLAGVKS
jgi:hypothetical protein